MGSITVGRLLAVQMMATKINTSIGRLNRAMREPRMVKHRASFPKGHHLVWGGGQQAIVHWGSGTAFVVHPFTSFTFFISQQHICHVKLSFYLFISFISMNPPEPLQLGPKWKCPTVVVLGLPSAFVVAL